MTEGMPQAGLRGRHVLVVEDELLVAMEVEALLHRHGCTVVGPAPSPARALALIEAEPIDVCVLDLNLNGERATPVAVALAARNVPFVVVSGYGRAQAADDALKNAPFLGKPMNDAELIRKLREVLDVK